MAVWPSTLPSGPLLEGFKFKPGETAIHTNPDEGPNKSRMRFTKPVHIQNWPLRLTNTQLNTFISFFYNDIGGGATPFDMTDPISGNTVSVKIIKFNDPETDNQYWKLMLDFMLMP